MIASSASVAQIEAKEGGDTEAGVENVAGITVIYCALLHCHTSSLYICTEEIVHRAVTQGREQLIRKSAASLP